MKATKIRVMNGLDRVNVQPRESDFYKSKWVLMRDVKGRDMAQIRGTSRLNRKGFGNSKRIKHGCSARAQTVLWREMPTFYQFVIVEASRGK